MGFKAFKEPAPVNANKTLVLMGVVLGSIFIGMTILAFAYHVMPDHGETVVSQIARAVFGDGSFLYYALQLITTLILILAANTSFSGFPRLANILANDGFLPRQFMSLGDRLVFSNGIIVLGLLSAILVWVYGADTHSLIPLYAVGVFLSFTLAQIGMVRYHRHQQQPGWRSGLIMNAIGGITTGVVTIILGVEKFFEGAWLVLVALPLFCVGFPYHLHALSNYSQTDGSTGPGGLLPSTSRAHRLSLSLITQPRHTACTGICKNYC